jgi:predicted ATPase
MLFGVLSKQQPREGFVTREEAGQRLLELTAAAGGADPFRDEAMSV